MARKRQQPTPQPAATAATAATEVTGGVALRYPREPPGLPPAEDRVALGAITLLLYALRRD